MMGWQHASTSSPIVSLVLTSAAASLLPSLLVQSLLAAVYRLFPSIASRRDRHTHAPLAHAAIVLAYSIYTLASAWIDLPPNYYTLLQIPGPPPSSSSWTTTTTPHVPASEVVSNSSRSASIATWKDRILRQRWLQLVRLYHPDKLGGTPEAEAHFRTLQMANEVLKSDPLRQAYERFGQSFIEAFPETQKVWRERDLFVRGATSALGWYIPAVIIFVLVPIFSSSSRRDRVYWRISTLLLLLSTEFSLVTSSDSLFTLPSILRLSNSSQHFTAHQGITLMRQAWITLNVLLTQLPSSFTVMQSQQQQRQYTSKSEIDGAATLSERLIPLIGASHASTDLSCQAMEQHIRHYSRDALGMKGCTTKHELARRIVEDLSGS